MCVFKAVLSDPKLITQLNCQQTKNHTPNNTWHLQISICLASYKHGCFKVIIHQKCLFLISKTDPLSACKQKTFIYIIIYYYYLFLLSRHLLNCGICSKTFVYILRTLHIFVQLWEFLRVF